MEHIIDYLVANYNFKIYTYEVTANVKHVRLRNQTVSCSLEQVFHYFEISLCLLKDVENSSYDSERHTDDKEDAIPFVEDWFSDHKKEVMA